MIGKAIADGKFVNLVVPVLLILSFFTNPVAAATKVVPAKEGIYHSAHPDFGIRDDLVNEARVYNFVSLAEKRIVWAYLSFHWDKGIHFPVESCRILYDYGVIPLVGIMPWSTLKQTRAEPKYKLDRIARGDFDAEIRKCAEDVKSLGFPIMIEFGPEVNGSWFPWSGAWNGRGADRYGEKGWPDGPERFRDAYRRIIDIFREVGADDVTWVFHAASQGAPRESWNKKHYYYPGDDYIDWIGLSLYGRLRGDGRAKSFREIMDEAYVNLKKVSQTKPIALLEFGVSESLLHGDKADWIRDAMDDINSGRYPDLKAVSWWNKIYRPDGTRSTLEIDSSRSSLEAYKSGIEEMYELPVLLSD